MAVDATMVSPVRADCLPRTGAAARDGVALTTARLRKQRTYPELSGRHRRCRLVVLATEIGGWWSSETRDFLRALARFRARSEPPLLRKRVEQAWRLRWWSILSCTAARALAASLVDSWGGVGADGGLPAAHEVEAEQAFAGLV